MILNRNNSNSNKSSGWLRSIIILCVVLIALFGARHKIKEQLQNFVSVDKAQIEQIVQDYIKQNPQLIISSIQDMKKREYEEQIQQAKMKIHDSKDAIQGKNSSITPYMGNANGDVTIVTFLDYRCGYCKRSNNDLKELVKKDPKVKIIFKELPVLGPQSQKLAKMALAVYLIDKTKYIDFHNSLMDADELDDKALEAIATKLKLNYNSINEKMNDEKVAKELEAIGSLAGEIGVRGTPAFIIDEELIPGAIDLNSLLMKIQEVRKNKS